MGNLITTLGGFLLASKGQIQFPLFFFTLVGLGLIIASACIWNNYIDRELDAKMERTKHRAFVEKTISIRNALLLASILGITGALTLAFSTPKITTSLAVFGFVIYVGLYSFWKVSFQLATLVGSIAGAIPIVVGYSAALGSLDLGALLLFALMVLWQMPHFFAIALYRLKDYQMANVPVLPVKKGVLATQKQMVFCLLAFCLVMPLLTFYHYTGFFYLITMSLLSFFWLLLCFRGFSSQKGSFISKWAYQMFRFSLLVILAQSALISLASFGL
jgi:protoheme IX farnesyltransferase